MQLPPEIVALAREQSGVVTRDQLFQLGVTAPAYRWALGRSWRPAMPGVVLLQTGPPTEQQRLMAGFLFAGKNAAVSSTTAAALMGVTACSLGTPYTFVIPAEATARRHHLVRISRTRIHDERTRRKGPLVLSSMGRAVVDAARAWIDELAVAVMVHSRQFHSGVLDWEATVSADADLVAAGVRVVGVTPHEISTNPDAVLSRVERTCLSAQGSRRPPVVATER